jgi:hypothetical protein
MEKQGAFDPKLGKISVSRLGSTVFLGISFCLLSIMFMLAAIPIAIKMPSYLDAFISYMLALLSACTGALNISQAAKMAVRLINPNAPEA